jgi:hypothetical protein
MGSVNHVGMDSHKETISIAVKTSAGKLIMECIIETKAITILQFIQGLRGDVYVIEAKSPVPCRAVSGDQYRFAKGSRYSLAWDMVDFTGRMLSNPRTKKEEPIHVPLNDAAVAALWVVHDRGDG